jgi:putative GTP pyrophosphokinase
MTSPFSKTQIDRLGDRLKKGGVQDEDLIFLDVYRRSFTEGYEFVVDKIRDDLKLEPTGRPAKSTTSITDKLRRESIRLTQIQDIAGCRLTVSDIINQDSVVGSLLNLFENVSVVDRREKPSHGYRAMHIIVNSFGKNIEVQVRTALQHLWAELSEKLSDVKDPSIKYGGGEPQMQTLLQEMSLIIFKHEIIESGIEKQLRQWSANDRVPESTRRDLETLHEVAHKNRQVIFERLRNNIEAMGK